MEIQDKENHVCPTYEITIDWDGELYCSLNLDWHYDDGCVDISMKNYVSPTCQKFNHKQPAKFQHALYRWTAPVYGSDIAQNNIPLSTAKSLGKEETGDIQSISGTFNYYTEIDPCIKTVLNEISTQQSAPT